MAAALLGYAELAWLALTRAHRLRDARLAREFDRQLHATGISALPLAIGLAALAGAAGITQVTALAGQDSDLAQKLLFYGLFFELAPLLSGVVMVARSSAGIASELAVMRVHDEFIALRRLGVPAADFLLLPRLLAPLVALPLVTAIFQAVSVGSGWLAVALLQDLPLLGVAGRFFDLAAPGLTLLALTKSAAMGLAIGAIACHHGTGGTRSTQSISNAAMQAVGNGLLAVFAIDVGFGALVWFAAR